MSKETTEQLQAFLTEIAEHQRKLDQSYGLLIFLALQIDHHNDELTEENERLRGLLNQKGEPA